MTTNLLGGFTVSKTDSRFTFMKSHNVLMAAATALLLATGVHAQITLTDLGSTNAPTPGPDDIFQLLNTVTGGAQNDDSLNYYSNNGDVPGQTFTTGSNPGGYVINTLAWQTAGNGSGFDNPQTYHLRFYSVSGSNATPIASYTGFGGGTEDDWFQWAGFNPVPLAPNSQYAYTVGLDATTGTGYEQWADQGGNPYAGGQICLINAGGGTITFGKTGKFDATFDIGVTNATTPVPATPVESPTTASLAALAGASVTFTAFAAGALPITYQWQTDGGTGTLTNIPGATGTNLVVDTTGFLPGTYQYAFVAANGMGSAPSPSNIIVIGTVFMEDTGTTNAPTPGPNDIAQLVWTPGADGNYNPDGFNYYTDNGAGHGNWSGQTFTTLDNPSGYIMNSLSWKDDANGNSFSDFQLYDLYIYSLIDNGSNAVNIASYQGYGGGASFDWYKWIGLDVILKPNTVYAYTFGRDPSSTGWESIGSAKGNPYPGGQLCTIPTPAGGPVTYGTTGTFDATFDIGLTAPSGPNPALPTFTPDINPIYAGTAVTFSELAIGTPPITYEWLTAVGTGNPFSLVSSGSSSNLVVDTTGFTANTYYYEVVVSNATGATTSSPVALNILGGSAPLIVTDITPSFNEGYVGQTVSFSASFTGTLPITLQWMVDTGSGPAPIPSSSNPSATNNTLNLTNLQLGNAGTYSLAANNSVGPGSSSSALLEVLVPPAPPASNSYAALVLSNGPVAYWRLNETGDPSTGVLPAYDATGNNFDGIYGTLSSVGVPGPQPPTFPGFESTNTALQTANTSKASYVTVPSLNLNTNTVTITAWINPAPGSSQTTYEGFLFWRNAANTDAAGLGFGGNVNSAGMPELGYTWNTNNGDTYGFNTGLYPAPNQWSFVALVVEPTQATIYMYYLTNGQPELESAANVIPQDVEAFNTATTTIGTDPFSFAGRSFSGDIDEVAVFNKSLTSSQILALFSEGVGLSAVPATISQEPAGPRAIYASNSVTFTAGDINGTPPFTYQWQHNGTNVSGATTLSLTINSATEANAGAYQLLVMNAVGTTTSSVVELTVDALLTNSYAATVLANDPFTYWPLNETNDPSAGGVVALDYIHGLNGVYQKGAKNGFDGIQGPQPPQYPGFPVDYTALETISNTDNSYVTASAGTLVATNLTYAMWINPSVAVENWAGLLMDRGGAGEGLGFGGSTNANGMSELGYTWNQNSTWSYNSYLFPPANQWSFVAMVIEPTKGTLYLINSNGVQTAVNAIPQDAETFGVAWHIGDDATGNDGSRTFPGSISSVSVFLSALSYVQVLGLYNQGIGAPPPVMLNVAQISPGNLSLSWTQGTLLQSTNLAGPWTTNSAATSPFPVATTNAQLFFKVLAH
jgi:hypothetical protein